MEREPKITSTINLQRAKQIMGANFIGPQELEAISPYFGIKGKAGLQIGSVPDIVCREPFLESIKNSCILILGVSKNSNGEKLTLVKMREMFGINPGLAEPCFYNQDWYLKEAFANNVVLESKWYLVNKAVVAGSRARVPEAILNSFTAQEVFPSAVLTAFVFFSGYLLNKEIFWRHDFVWCSDTDTNGDRIYTGRYEDPNHINKNGFNVHRHLSLRPCYGSAPQIII